MVSYMVSKLYLRKFDKNLNKNIFGVSSNIKIALQIGALSNQLQVKIPQRQSTQNTSVQQARVEVSAVNVLFC